MEKLIHRNQNQKAMAMAMRREKERVCVTGGGGYIASWLVKFLLSKGYTVHATLRDPCDAKNDHLKKLGMNLKVFKSELLDFEAMCKAISRCVGVFHVASPVAIDNHSLLNPQLQLIEPALTGTRNVLNACSNAKVKKVVVVSSASAVAYNPNWPKDQVMDEQCWSDLEYCKEHKRWYALAKTLAAMEAMEYAKKSPLNIITVCPSFVVGPMMQSTMNATSSFFLNFLKGVPVDFGVRPLVDVRDVAEALILVYENPTTEGRYICASHSIATHDLEDILKTMYPDNYICPTPTGVRNMEARIMLSSEKLQRVGWRIRPLETTIADAVRDYQEKGVLNKDKPWPWSHAYS